MLSVQELSQVPTNPGSCSIDGDTGLAACALLDALNTAANPRAFQLAASPRDCTVASCTDAQYNEQYMVVWDSARVELVASATFPDPDGAFERDPWAAHLRDIASGDEFALLAIHTPPSAATAEILAMGSVLSWAAAELTENVILLGDYNADGSYVDEGTQWPTLFGEAYGSGTLGDAFELVADDALDTTVAASSNAYDRAIISSAWQSDSVAAGGGVGTVFAFDALVDLSSVWTEGCGTADYIGTADCTARDDGSLSTEQSDRIAAQEVSDHFVLELTLCLAAADVDCAGEWSACAADCGPKTFTVSVAASGSGSACAAEDGATLTCSAGEGACPEAEAETPPPAPNLNTGDAKADTSGAATASCSIGLLLAAIALAVEAGDVAGLRDSAVFQECEEVAQAMEADAACDAP
eukprot:COSAG04_NODE_2229_length_4486_cov_1.760656_3_plen_412_part_00